MGLNLLELILPEFFYGMDKLRELSLTGNDITVINPFKSTWKNNIEVLDLSWNGLYLLKAHTFKGLRNLKFLDLHMNVALMCLEISSLSGLDNLETLDISSTSLYELTLYAPLLKSFQVSKHGSAIVPGETFSITKNLENITIVHSSLSASKLRSENHTSLFAGLQNLKSLVLAGNNFSVLPPGVFTGLSSVEVLDLSSCQMYSIFTDAFGGLSSLKVLNLKDNYLQMFPTLDALPQLTNLHLDKNDLKYIDMDAFVSTSRLAESDSIQQFFYQV